MEAKWEPDAVPLGFDDEVDHHPDVPAPVLDALVDAAWSLPGLRVAFARLDYRQLHVLASAGPEQLFDQHPQRLDLSGLPRLLAALHDPRQEPIEIEDVSTDPRTRDAPSLTERAQAMLLVPLPSRQGCSGAALVESPKPKTWSRTEHLALERLIPLLTMAADNFSLRESLELAREQIRDYERRTCATVGLGRTLVHELRSTLAALARPRRDHDDAQLALHGRALQLLDELWDACGSRVGERMPENLDLEQVLETIRPCLRALLPAHVALRMDLEAAKNVQLCAYRAGLERLLINLVLQHTRGSDSQGGIQTLHFVVEPVIGSDIAILLRGPVTPASTRAELLEPDAELDLPRWLVRVELRLHDARVCNVATGERPAVRLVFPRRSTIER